MTFVWLFPGCICRRNAHTCVHMLALGRAGCGMCALHVALKTCICVSQFCVPGRGGSPSRPAPSHQVSPLCSFPISLKRLREPRTLAEANQLALGFRYTQVVQCQPLSSF